MSRLLTLAITLSLSAAWAGAGAGAVAGEIRRYESKRLVLHTDIDPEFAADLPKVLDSAYEAWEAYFGKHPGDSKERPFRITGCVMADPAAFAKAGLLPARIERFLKGAHPGKHEGRRFWMKDQESHYYREHLMVHEATHCFMTTQGGGSLPVWYLEGTAELFATHWFEADRGRFHWAWMPFDEEWVPGWGRIDMIRRDVRRGRLPTFSQLAGLWTTEHSRIETYAWSWAFTKFLHAHPRYRKRFGELGRHLSDGQWSARFERAFREDWPQLQFEWQLAARHLIHGFDFQRSAITFHRATPLKVAGRRTVVAADRGWQSTAIRVKAGQIYQLTAEGRFTLADRPKPWVSEADGISFRYHAGLPLGRLVCVLRPDDRKITRPPKVVSIGSKARIRPKVPGTLFLRVNDFLSELADNTGALTVEIVPVANPPGKATRKPAG